MIKRDDVNQKHKKMKNMKEGAYQKPDRGCFLSYDEIMESSCFQRCWSFVFLIFDGFSKQGINFRPHFLCI